MPPLDFGGIPVDFEPRDGDVLVVSYGEVTVPLPKPYSNVKVGGNSYRRQLREGDNVVEQFEKIANYLKGVTEVQAKERVATWSKTLKGEKAEG